MHSHFPQSSWPCKLLFLCLIFTGLELEFTKLEFHMVFFFFNYNSTSNLDLLDHKFAKLNFGLELDFNKLEFQK